MKGLTAYMCVIIVAEKGIKVPMENLEKAWNANSDGAGMCYLDSGLVRIRKGFMKFDEFKQALREVPLNVDRMFHFRIATAGRVTPGMTHPYPVEMNLKAMYATDMRTSMACMHNGVISWCNPPLGSAASFSDSMAFIANYLYPVRKDVMDNIAIQMLISYATSSKFGIMTPNGVVRIGNFVEIDGVYYSNTSWKYNSYYPSACMSTYYQHYAPFRSESDASFKCPSPTLAAPSSRKSIQSCYDYDDDYCSYTGYTPKSSHHSENVDDMIGALMEAGTDINREDICVLAFTHLETGMGLNYHDADVLLDTLTDSFNINIYGCDFDEMNKTLYVTVEWKDIIELPTSFCGASWSVVG